MNIDPTELLRAQGDMMAHNRVLKAEKAQADRLAKECTFAPDTKKPKYKTFNKKPYPNNEDISRASLGSINLEGIAKKKDDDPFALAQPADQGAAKYNQLYSMRKRQLDKIDKSKEDYEFERQ